MIDLEHANENNIHDLAYHEAWDFVPVDDPLRESMLKYLRGASLSEKAYKRLKNLLWFARFEHNCKEIAVQQRREEMRIV